MNAPRKMLAVRPVTIAGFDIAGVSRYCDETGGDYVDFIELAHDDERRVAIAIGDASGHGPAAATVMERARATLRGSIDTVVAPQAAMDRANRLLCAEITDGSFMTLVLLVIDTSHGIVRWVNAAHDAPLVIHRPTGAFVPLAGADVPLGIDAAWRYTEHATHVPPGEVLIALGTDGIWETEAPGGAQFGRERWELLVQEFGDRSAAELCRTIVAAVDAFRDGGRPADDVTLVIIKYTVSYVG